LIILPFLIAYILLLIEPVVKIFGRVKVVK